MSTGAPPISQEAALPTLSQVQRVIHIFSFSPSKTFADVRRNPSWWVPFLLVTLATTAFIATVDKKVGFDVVSRKAMDHLPEFAQKAMQQLPAEQRQQAFERQVGRQRIFGLYLNWVFTLIFSLIIAGVFMGIFNFVLEADLRFRNSLAVVFYAWLPKVVFCLLAIAVLLKGVDPDGFELENPATTNLAFLVDPSTSSRFLYHLLSGIDLIAAWEVGLLGIGFSMLSTKKINPAAGITTVAVVYGIYLLIRSALPF